MHDAVGHLIPLVSVSVTADGAPADRRDALIVPHLVAG
jgi:hypothetical protein